MVDTAEQIIKNVLTAFYNPLLFVVTFSALVMLLFPSVEKSGIKALVKQAVDRFRHDSKYRRYFYFVFFTTMVLFKTLYTRSLWIYPLSDVIGVWGLYNKKGEFTTQAIENFMMFIPFTVFLLWAFRDKILKKERFVYLLWQSCKFSFIFSLGIEMAQLIFRLGTFQLSDLFYNTLGGIIGGIIYYVLSKLISKILKKRKNK